MVKNWTPKELDEIENRIVVSGILNKKELRVIRNMFRKQKKSLPRWQTK